MAARTVYANAQTRQCISCLEICATAFKRSVVLLYRPNQQNAQLKTFVFDLLFYLRTGVRCARCHRIYDPLLILLIRHGYRVLTESHWTTISFALSALLHERR